jgi:predicted TIM-barrel fold metal-dependent hydrolase
MNTPHTRRRWMKQVLGGLAAAAATPAPGAAAARRIVDCHTHFYDPTRAGGVPWPPVGTALYRPVYPKDWLALASKHGIRETVVVEASKLVEDNDWILALAEKEKAIVGFVGNLQPTDPATPGHLKRLAANPLFRGIRASVAGLADPATQGMAMEVFKLMASLDLSLDVSGTKSLEPLAKLAREVPDLRIVINHCGGCGDPKKLSPEWRAGITAAAAQGNVSCKVSALAEMADAKPGQAPVDAGYYQPILDHLWNSFGADRLIYGSNWPVSDRGTTYDGVFRIVSEWMATQGAEASEKYFWKNARAIYKFRERAAP